jgi:hypothetical protein
MILDYETPQPREPLGQDFWDIVLALTLFVVGYVLFWNI